MGSRPDEGQYDAIARGFEQTTGDVMAWLNAGDVFLPWALQLVGELFAQFPQIEWLTTQRPLILDERRHRSAVGVRGRLRRAAPFGPA